MPGFPLWKKVVGLILQPLLILKSSWMFLTLPTALNCIKKAYPTKINGHVILSEDYDYAKFRKSRKILKCSDV